MPHPGGILHPGAVPGSLPVSHGGVWVSHPTGFPGHFHRHIHARGVYGFPVVGYDVFPSYYYEEEYPECYQSLHRVHTRHGWRVRRVTICS